MTFMPAGLLRILGCALLIPMMGTAAPSTDFFFLADNHFSCPSERKSALIATLDAPNSASRQLAIQQAIYGGHCAAAQGASLAISELKNYRTPSGNAYSCFSIPAMGAGEFCAPANMIKSVKWEQKNRSGDYTISIDNAVMIKAICKEGGIVLIQKDKTAWKRMSLVFAQQSPVVEQLVKKNRDAAIRDGCKGADYVPGIE
jgi:hypothetical protein